MPTEKTVGGWNISCVGYDVQSEGSVWTIWCKICREFYDEMKKNTSSSSIKGVGQMGKFFLLLHWIEKYKQNYFCILLSKVALFTKNFLLLFLTIISCLSKTVDLQKYLCYYGFNEFNMRLSAIRLYEKHNWKCCDMFSIKKYKADSAEMIEFGPQTIKV